MKKITAAFLLGIIFGLTGSATAYNTAVRYPDVSEKDWFYGPVMFMTENALAAGYSNGKFGPNDPATRAQVATMFSNYDNHLLYNKNAVSDIAGILCDKFQPEDFNAKKDAFKTLCETYKRNYSGSAHIER